MGGWIKRLEVPKSASESREQNFLEGGKHNPSQGTKN